MSPLESFATKRAARAGVAIFTVVTAGVVAVQLGSGVGSSSGISFLDHALATMAEPQTVGQSGWDISNIDHNRVDMWIGIYTTRPKLRDRFAVWLERKPKYEAMISEKLAARGMPQDLIYLAMIESGFNPKAYSHAKAGGLWQFIAETGQRYGLEVNRRVDERNHPDKATDAALAYLTDLHERFGSWYLAAAAYNTGENRVGRIMREVTGKERGTDADYYRISSRLPRETRDYVPMMIAAARISKDPAKYGFGPESTHRRTAAAEVAQEPRASE
ncbi:MAG TPA: lytic transglycosylase domain-containing protein [Gemmatimonadaceae bacterium]|nr:lytic transglycosylase domain-containing protein [Gemmatimonadaceae bacterium]